MSSRRSRLFLALRLFFWANVFTFFVLVGWFFYLRSQRSRLIEVVERQLAFNILLSSDLAYANNLLTNKYFSAASSFVSNLVVSVAPSIGLPVVSNSIPLSAASSDDLPPLTFRSYFEVDGVPHIRLRNQNLKRGDFVLGFPLEDISPDVVKYRGKYFKVEETSK